MENKNIKASEDVFKEFENLRYDLRFKENQKRTQSEQVKFLLNFWKINNKKVKKK